MGSFFINDSAIWMQGLADLQRPKVDPPSDACHIAFHHDICMAECGVHRVQCMQNKIADVKSYNTIFSSKGGVLFALAQPPDVKSSG